MLNLSHRDGSAAPATLPLDEVLSVRVALDHTAYRVPAGHRPRVAVCNAYWPLVWPAPEAGALTLVSGGLDLPCHEGGGTSDARSFPPPEAAEPWQVEELRAATHVRRSETDHRTGIVSLVIEDDFGARRDLAHGAISGGVARERWSIHPDDPLSAHGICHWTEENGRDGLRLRTESRCEMWADATHFHLSASIEAYENDTRIHHRRLSDTIARDHL